MNRIRVSRRVEKKLAKGLVLLEASDLTDIDLTDQAVEVLSQDGKFLGSAYLSQQNKGIGWFINKEKVGFNQDFFEALWDSFLSSGLHLLSVCKTAYGILGFYC